MIKFNFDVSTSRRIGGWAINLDTGHFPDIKIRDAAGGKEFPILPIIRKDVSEAYGLEDELLGFDLVVPDLFDEWLSTYEIVLGEDVLFSYRSELENFRSHVGDYKINLEAVDYSLGRHLVFIYDLGDELNYFFSCLNSTVGAALFPNKIGSLKISAISTLQLKEKKNDVMSNLENIAVVCSDEMYAEVGKISPTVASSSKAIIFFNGYSLVDGFGLFQMRLNNFVYHKNPLRVEAPDLMESMVAIWSVFDQYQDVIFLKKREGYFFAYNSGENLRDLVDFVRENIQGISAEDIIRVRDASGNVCVMINLASYLFLFDMIGDAGIWKESLRRGLSYRDFLI